MDAPLTTAELATWVAGLAQLDADVSDAERVDRLRFLEDAKGAIAAAQAREAVALRRSRQTAARASGASAREVDAVGAAVTAEVALARRESPRRGSTMVGLAVALVEELPCTLRALSAGQLSEWRAMLVCRETACLSREDRARVDALLEGTWSGLSDRQLVARVRQHAYELDPHSVVERSARAVADRQVTIRPAPDTMTWVSALLPVAQGVAAYASLRRAADSARACGDERSQGQVMADVLVERVTGQASADQVPVEVQMLITDQALLAGGSTPARIAGYGPIPAEVARRMLAGLDDATDAWVRRLYVRPTGDELVAMESSRRVFPPAMRLFLTVRDDVCRTPWCGAPIRHADHVVPAHRGGPTSIANGQGLCERCNQLKEAPGWRASPGPGGEIVIRTPSGHEYASRPPPLPDDRVTPRVEFTFPATAIRIELFDAA